MPDEPVPPKPIGKQTRRTGDTTRKDGWRKVVGDFLGHSIPGVVIGLVIAYLAMAGVTDMTAARVILRIAWVLATITVARSEFVYKKRFTTQALIILFCGVVLATCGLKLDGWASRKSNESKRQERLELAKEVVNTIPVYPEILTNAAIVHFGSICDGCCSKPQTVNLAGVRPGDTPIGFI